MRRQFAVYWGPSTPDQYGQKTFVEPVELRVRWEDVSEVFMGRNGVEQVSRSKVYVPIDVQEDGVLWLGRLNDIADGVPFLNSKAWVIRKFEKLPTLKADQFLRTAYL